MTKPLEEQWQVDAVTAATPLYEPTFNYSAGGKPNQPAVTMTQFAARQYTKWLSGITGREFRLPTEAEWEYAARAGTSTAFCFGDDTSSLAAYGWFDENSEDRTHPVATKKPNAWGIYDIHGNVAEWTLDQYYAKAYGKLGLGIVDSANAVQWPKLAHSRVIRGGSWLESASACRSAARQKSEDDDWKMSDPNFPLGPWWFTEDPATAVGMRIVRPLEAMSSEEKQKVCGMQMLRPSVRTCATGSKKAA